MPVFTISAASRRSKRTGYFKEGEWQHLKASDGEPIYAEKEEKFRPDEINIDGQRGMARSFISIAATVFHEMSHQAQHHYPEVYGKAAKAGNYHNRKWHETCRICGLETEGSTGVTTVTEEFKGFMRDFPNPERWIAQKTLEARDVATTRLKKWTCQCEEHFVDKEDGIVKDGPYIIRAAGTGLKAMCRYCGKAFTTEKDD